MGKHIRPASLGSSDPYAGARNINSTSRDALPALPLGDVGFGAPQMGEDGASYATSDAVPPPAPSGGQGASSGGGASHPMDRPGMMGSAPSQARQPTPDELMAHAQSMLDHTAAQPTGSSLGARDAGGSQVTDANGHKLPEWLTREQEGK